MMVDIYDDNIVYEVEACDDVPVDTIFVLNGHGIPEMVEVKDDDDD